jgi:hypothetical protein
MKLTVVCAALVLSVGAVFAGGRTLWQDGGVQLCGTSAWGQMVASSDDAGGAIVMWTDLRDGWDYFATYAQRVDAAGVPQWTQNGVRLCDSMDEGFLAGTGDGWHGAIAVRTGGDGALVVQRASGDGVPLWGPDGVTLRPPTESMGVSPALVGDAHGATVVWRTTSIYFQTDTLLACRVDSSGSKKWETVVRINKLSGGPLLCPDGFGGVIIAWSENYGGPVRAQRVDSAGAVRWDPAGVLACTLSTALTARACVAVSESCFVVGHYVHSGDIWQIRAQIFDLAGNRLWGPAGKLVTGANDTSARGGVGLSAGNHGQSVWLWSENKAGTTELLAQKLDSVGSRCWDTAGVWLGSIKTSGGQFAATVDGRGGAIAVWTLYRSSQNWDIYAQHIDSAGHLCWSDTGLAVCRDTNNATWPGVVSDGGGGAIISWFDDRGLYAQRVADGAGIAEAMSDERGTMNAGPTVIQGALFLPEAATSRKFPSASLLNVCGCNVLDLHGGANDISRVAPGVYFVRGNQAQTLAVRKVIIAR